MTLASTPLIDAKDGKLKNFKSLKYEYIISILGPGLMVCLADSDIGGLFTMTVAGAQYGYALLSLQLLLIPVLYTAQHLALVLGVCTGRSLVGLVDSELSKVAALLLGFVCILVGATAV